MGTEDLVRLVVACVVSLSAGLIGSPAGADGSLGSWYATIERPAFTPPNWLSGPVWTVLYVLMGVAAFLVWRQGLRSGVVRIALV